MTHTGPLLAVTNLPSSRLADCELTFVDRQPIDVPLALSQHAAYREALASCGVAVRCEQLNAESPDGTFLEDTAIVLDEVAIMARPGTVSRRGEPAAVAEILREYRELRWLQPPATIEGGDVLRMGKTLLVGHSRRSNEAGLRQLAELAGPWGYQVIPVSVRGCLHLKTALGAVDEQRLLVNREWLDTRPLAGYELVDLPPEEPWGANLVAVGGRLLLSAEAPRTAERLASQGADVLAVDLSEFAKAEAGATCLSLIFRP